MNKKEEKIKRLWNRGIKDPATIAKKLGYKGGQLTHAIGEIRQVVDNHGENKK